MTAKIKLNAASGGGSVSLEAPTSTTGNANVEFKLPVADGSSGQALTTNASGQLAFASVAGGKIGQVLSTKTALHATQGGQVSLPPHKCRRGPVLSTRLHSTRRREAE